MNDSLPRPFVGSLVGTASCYPTKLPFFMLRVTGAYLDLIGSVEPNPYFGERRIVMNIEQVVFKLKGDPRLKLEASDVFQEWFVNSLERDGVFEPVAAITPLTKEEIACESIHFADLIETGVPFDKTQFDEWKACSGTVPGRAIIKGTEELLRGRGICTCDDDQLALTGHKWQHVISECFFRNCSKTGNNTHGDTRNTSCTDGVQTQDQRGWIIQVVPAVIDEEPFG